MGNSFIEYTYNRQLQEAQGRSGYNLELPITQPMANFLSIIKGNWMRARALDWLMFDGLKKAIVGREELCGLVNKAIKGELYGGVLKANLGQGKKAIGEAREPRSFYGEDPFEEGEKHEIRPCDLFSPEAWKRRPELTTLRLNGLTIIDYYEKFYEPRSMIIDYTPGRKASIDIRRSRQFLEAHGLEGFKYGGADGYMQYVEKGDWQHPVYRKGIFSNNDQTGPDLRLDGKPEESITYDEKSRPVLHLMGGPYVKDDRRSAETIDKMRATFTNVAKAISSGKDLSNIPPETTENVKNLLDLNGLIKKSELTFDASQKSKAGKHRQLTGTNSRESYFFIPSDPELDIDSYLSVVKVGLSRPLGIRDVNYFKLSALGTEWDGNGNPPPVTEDTGWYQLGFKTIRGTPGVIFCAPKSVQRKMFDYVTRNRHSNQTLNVTIRMKDVWPEVILTKEDAPNDIKRVTNSRRNTKINVSTLFNSGVASSPNLAKIFKKVYFTSPNIKQSDFVKKIEEQRKEVTNIDEPQNDPTIGDLFQKGYRWEVRDKYENENQEPNWMRYGDGVLRMGTDRFVVEYERDPSVPKDPKLLYYQEGRNKGKIRNEFLDPITGKPKGKYYLLIPKDVEGRGIEPASYGALGTSMLSGGVSHRGGQGLGHIRATPAGDNTYKKLLTMLMNGELGEKNGKANNIGDLSSIEEAIKRALAYWDRYQKIKKTSFDDKQYELLNWAEEGMRLFSGHSAFQVGYVSQDEILKILQWNAEKQNKMFLKKQGIQYFLYKLGLDTPKLYQYIVDGVEEGFKQGKGIMDYSVFPPEYVNDLRKIFWMNAYEARVREISKYIVAMMTREETKDQKSMQNQGLTGSVSDDEESGFTIDSISDDDKRRRSAHQDIWQDPEQIGIMSRQELRRIHNIPEPKESPDVLPPNKPLATISPEKMVEPLPWWKRERPVLPQQSNQPMDIFDIGNSTQQSAKPRQRRQPQQSNQPVDIFNIGTNTQQSAKPRQRRQPQQTSQPVDIFDIGTNTQQSAKPNQPPPIDIFGI